MVNKRVPALTESLEDYIYDIYEVLEREPVARIKDIAGRRNVKFSSVVNAVKTLHKIGLVEYKKYGYVVLTDEGRKAAEALKLRKKLLFEFLVTLLGVSPENAERDVHKMEHFLSAETIEKIIEFMNRMNKTG